ncbi:hypothetical protein Bhyg_07084 [Pseudolycoriella hygida]|uniref:Chitin-binding type-2 domain-containing protein n=1 Tax=Pseudolycoriella hygida TaxID=35572 RepID=A0A9Q0N318_9DIPT|nr:hypothetical protein Bhyg_07084 [Pseudolycoriella hygida]
MKFLILCFFVAAECAAIGVNGYVSTLQTFAVGIKITSSRGGATCTKTKTGPECADDCSTLMICSTFDTAPLDKKICQAPNQYCVKDSCTSVADAKCGGGASVGTDFLCTDVGLFPEPSDCTKYYECSDSGNSQPYVCPSGFVFNSKINVCQIGKTPCTKISCDKATEANPFILYTSNPA